MKPNDVKEALERFLNSSSPELTRLLVRYWKDQQTVFTFKEIREAIQAGVISKKSVEEWQQDYSKLVHDKIVPEMVKAIPCGLYTHLFFNPMLAIRPNAPALLEWQ